MKKEHKQKKLVRNLELSYFKTTSITIKD